MVDNVSCSLMIMTFYKQIGSQTTGHRRKGINCSKQKHLFFQKQNTFRGGMANRPLSSSSISKKWNIARFASSVGHWTLLPFFDFLAGFSSAVASSTADAVVSDEVCDAAICRSQSPWCHFFLEVGGGERDSIVSTLEALRVISINFVLVISMIIDNHHDAFFFWVGGGGGAGGRVGRGRY